MPKFVFVTGGVLSSLGKGILSASISRLLRSRGINANNMKIDPYLNCDAGTLNPFEHGECFVTRDGFECDLDLGNYERFLDIYAKREQNLMMGAAFKQVIDQERHGDFLGKTIQLIPHLTNEIKRRIKDAASATKCDVLVIEIGGTVGDYESEMVFEAARQMHNAEGPGNVMFVHIALVPTIITGEMKTKPLQHSVRELLARGILPDILVGRGTKPISKELKEKIALFCNVTPQDVFSSPDLSDIYELPIVLKQQGLDERLAEKMGLKLSNEDMKELSALIEKMQALAEGKERVKIAVVGKYAFSNDAYASVFESLLHAGVANNVAVDAKLFDSEQLEKKSKKEVEETLSAFDGIIVPGGFGSRGVEGKISAIQFARENNKPYLGLCFGMQLAVIETARNVLGWKDANSTEIDEKTGHPVIYIMPEQHGVSDLGGTLRLGGKKTVVEKGTVAHKLYGTDEVIKRHRHRYEVNPKHIAELEKSGMAFSGKSEDGRRMEILEMPGHPFFMGTQYHPEFDSRLGSPEPLFFGLVKAASEQKKNQAQ
ncbi:MAG: CTP synthase [Candidatus Micrarchaeia archaeon]|jgi:CTP synthase